MAVHKTICSVFECGRGSHKRGFCGAHYQRLMKHGDVLANVAVVSRAKVDRSAICVIDGCDRPVRRGITRSCDPHYKRLWRHGDASPEKPLAAPRAESIPVTDYSDGSRLCQTCNMRKPLGEFHQDKRSPGGRRKVCKPCRTQVEVARYNADPERAREKSRLARLENPERYRLIDMARYERDRDKRVAAATAYTHVRRARMALADIDDGVTVLALRKLDGDRCCYCSATMVFKSFSKGSRADNQATLEHVNPISRGGSHTFANCALACWRCNISKGAANDWAVRPGHRITHSIVEVGA